MDPRSDVTAVSDDAEPAGAKGGTPTTTTISTAVYCDQAIFTSACSATGTGYRLVAASRGLRADEKQEIVKRSPSHDGLCNPSPDAVGVSFYPLASGRLAVAYTCCAGLEQSARGGQRIYTRAVVLEQQGFAQFGYNPFEVIRSLIDSGQAEPDLQPPPELATLKLGAGLKPDFDGLADCMSRVGPAWARCTLDSLLEGKPTVVVGDFPFAALIESVLLGLPGPVRTQLSFAAGLRYSLGRGFELSALAGDAVRLRQSLRGHSIELLEPAADRIAPTPSDAAWGRMVQHRWERGRWDDLNRLTSRPYADCSAAALDYYGRLCRRRDDVEHQDYAALIATLDEYAAKMPQDELATELTVALVSDALRQLTDLLSTAPIEDLNRHWGAVAVQWCRSASTSAILAPLVGMMLKRMTRLSPVEAAQAAPRILADVGTRPHHIRVRQALDDLLDHLGEWLHDQPTDKLHLLEGPLRRWPPAGLFADRVRELRDQIASRVAGGATAEAEATP